VQLSLVGPPGARAAPRVYPPEAASRAQIDPAVRFMRARGGASPRGGVGCRNPLLRIPGRRYVRRSYSFRKLAARDPVVAHSPGLPVALTSQTSGLLTATG
jgi:hypothetical protein